MILTFFVDLLPVQSHRGLKKLKRILFRLLYIKWTATESNQLRWSFVNVDVTTESELLSEASRRLSQSWVGSSMNLADNEWGLHHVLKCPMSWHVVLAGDRHSGAAKRKIKIEGKRFFMPTSSITDINNKQCWRKNVACLGTKYIYFLLWTRIAALASANSTF